jgi:hypothetical protein
MKYRSVAILLGLAALCAPAAAQRPQAAPLISITSQVPEGREVETRLMLFISALQRGQRLKAAGMLSGRVSVAERNALLQNRWLKRKPSSRSDVTQVLFLPDLQIRTDRLYKDARTLVVLPRKKAKKVKVTGAMRVIMRKEHGSWLVELHPDRSVARR